MSKRRDWEELSEVVSKIREMGLSLKEGAEEYGVKTSDLYEYNRRFKKRLKEDEQKKQRGTQASKKEKEGQEEKGQSEENEEKPVGLPEDIERIIIDYKKQNPDHGFKRIQDHLKSKHLVVIERKKIRKVLKAHGLLKLGDSSFDRAQEPEKGSRRFEARFPRELYQMDVTYVYITGIPVLYLVDIVDDYSRYCVSAELCRDQRSDTLIEVLLKGSDRHGKPQKLLTDQGSGFYSWSFEHTLFQKYLDDAGIEHIVAEPHSPQTTGKVERFHQSIKNELIRKVRFENFEEAKRGISDYIVHYNHERPHQGIGGARPADRFHGVIGETSRLEAQLCGKQIDFTKGYLVWKLQGHTVSVASGSQGLEVYLDGNLLRT